MEVIQHQLTDEDGDTKTLFFAHDCNVFTGSTRSGLYTRCMKYKQSNEEKLRKQTESGTTFHPNTNNKYLTRQELVEKINYEQKMRQDESRRKIKIEEGMLEMEEEDHKDLKVIMDSINKKDVLENVSLFWDQNKKQTHSKMASKVSTGN